MKRKICIGLVLIATLVSPGMTPSLAQSSQHNEDWAVSFANTTSPAWAPWFFKTVDSYPPYDVGQHVSLALHPVTGAPYVSYYDASHKDLRMAKYVSSGGNCGPHNTWSCEIVDSAGDVGKYSSIAIDPTDNLPIISYYDATNRALKLAVRTVFSWQFKTIYDPDLVSAGLFTSMKLGSVDKIRIAFYVSNLMGDDSLWYAKYVGGGTGNCGGNDYQCVPINSGDQVGKYASLALDSSDRPRIAYYDGGYGFLKYAYYDGSWFYRWILSTPSGKYASLVVDVNHGDLPHIAHYDSTNGTLEYAVYVGSGGNCGMSSAVIYEWQCDDIDNVGAGINPKGVSITVDGAGYPIIAYQSGGSVLKVARPAAALGQLIGNCGPQDPFYTWQCEAISFGVSIGQGDYVSLAVNSAGLATIAYHGNISASDGDLKVAYQRLQVFLPLTLKN